MTTHIYCNAVTRTPPRSMAAGITTQQESVSVELAREQHRQYVKTLTSLGVDVTVLDPAEDYPDSHFVEDAVIIHRNIAIMTRPGAVERRGEVGLLKSSLQDVMDVIELGGGDEALVDGGDVLFMGQNVFIGISHRTNHAGASRLKAILHDIEPDLSIHFVPFSGVLHLKSGVTALNADTLLGNPAMKLPTALPAGNIVWLSQKEGYAANALILNGAALYFPECPSAGTAAQQAGLRPIALDMSEFRKMDGSFTCLSLLW